MSLKIVWKLRERRKQIIQELEDIELQTGMPMAMIQLASLGTEKIIIEDELRFINELLGENG